MGQCLRLAVTCRQRERETALFFCTAETAVHTGVDILPDFWYNLSMREQDTRTALLLGECGVEKLHESRVAVFGLGGVGGFCAEALARAGVGHLTLVDKDVVEESNINRQIVALMSTVGQHKTEIMRRRIADIDPACNVAACTLFYLPETAHLVPLAGYDYIADCIDNVTAKLHLITAAQAAGVPVVSAMGAGNKLDPARFRVSDLAETKTDPLARIMRRELKKRGVEHLPVVWSDELPMPVHADMVGSVSFVPSVMGLIMAGHIVKELVK